MKNSNLLNRLLSYSHEKQSPQRFARYAAMLIMLLTLGVGQMWGYNKVYLRGDMKGIGWDPGYYWNSESGEHSTETYAANGNGFKLYIDGVNDWVGYCSKSGEKSSISSDGTGTRLYKDYSGSDDENVTYSGCNGIVCFHVDQKTGNHNDNPWVWITRPTVYLKNHWNNTSPSEQWSWKSTTDEGNGYYYVDAAHGANGVNWGTNGTSAWQKNSTDVYIQCTPSPSTLEAGRKCRYRLNTNPSGDSWDAATPTLTITGIYTVTFNMKGHGDAIDTQEILYNETASTPDAPSATGYTFGGWYTDEGCTSAFNWSTAITADRVLYAKWTEKSYSLTFATDGHGTVAVGGDDVASGSTATVNHHTTKTLVATNNTGYSFSSWTLSGSNTSAVTIGNTSNASTTIKTSNTGATVTANFTADTYTASGNLKKTTGGTDGTYTATYDALSIVINTAPTKTGYHVDGYYKSYTSSPSDTWTTLVASANGALESDVTDITTGTAWKATSSQNLYTKWAPNTYTIKFDPNEDGLTTYVGDVSGTTADKAATYDASATLTSNGYSRDGYDFVGWNMRADTAGTSYTDGQSVSNLTTTNEGTVTLYAKWKAKQYTVTLNATQNGGTCATKTTTVTMGSTYGAGSAGSLPDASAPSGYRFAGWYTAATDGTKVTDAMQVTTANDHTLYAHFTEITYVYFYNNLNWGAVYVTYDPYWDVDQYGTANTNGAGNYGKIYHQMQPIEEGSPIYRDEIPSSVIASWKFNICFNSKQLGSVGESSNWVNFDSGEAIFRRDFDSYATMFVPDPTEKTVKKNSDKVTYCSTDQWVDHKDNDEKKEIIDYRYKKGYWMKYNRYMSGDAGYVIKGKWDNESNDFYFRKVTEGNSYTFTKYLPAGQTYKFRIYKHCKTSNTYSSWFIGNKDATITSSITDWTLDAGIDKGHTDWYDQLTTTIAGDYTFTVRCNTNGVLKLDVTYPGLTVDNSWYRLLYSWDDGSAHSRVCETFYRSDNGGSEWVDAFIHKASYVTSQSLKLQKYVTVSSTPTWQDVESITLPSDIITKNGIYTFRIVRNGGEEATCTYIGPFEGTLFLRSDVTAGGWDYYPHIAFSGTQDMTYSEYSAQQKTDPYSHYYCKYIDNATQNVAFTIATYNTGSICDTLVGDDIIGAADNAATKYKHLPSGNPANIRFMYNDSTNTIKRAYLKSAQGSGRTRFLVLHGNTHVYNTDETDVRPADSLGLQNDEFIFIDRGNWVYELNFKASPIAKAKVIAQYNGTTSAADRYLVGGSGDTDSDWKTILGAPSDDLDHKYALAATYDFKTNRLMVAWTPDGTDITAKLSDIDMLWVRVGDGAATQINFGEGGSLSKISAVGAIKINWSDVNGRVGTWNEYTRTYAKYFVSFPFDVNVSDIFGLNGASMGREYVIQKYNGARRAQDGLFLGDDATFWENLTMDSTMHANEGYLVMFDNDYLNYDYSSMWNNNKGAGKYIYMYFPAAKQISSISNAATNTIVAPHQSERKEYWTVGGKTYKMSDTDSHWNLIGGPFFHNATISSSTPGEGLSDLHAYYRPKTDNTWEACVLAAPNEKGETINNAFKAMSCIMVQWHGTLTWNTTSTVPAFISARNMEEKKNYLVQLDLTRGEEYSDHAFVDLQEGANSDFVLCEDMMKVVRGGLPNVYVYAGAYDVAYSQVPVENQTIPVGAIIPQDGTYTFTMPTNFSGTVTLIDTYAQTRTNLALEDYEIYLEKGTINDRFFLEININKVPTAIDGVSGEGSLKDGQAHKFIMNDMMYILKDGVIYDARGNRVK